MAASCASRSSTTAPATSCRSSRRSLPSAPKCRSSATPPALRALTRSSSRVSGRRRLRWTGCGIRTWSIRSATGSRATGHTSGSVSGSSSSSRVAMRTAPRRSASCRAGPSCSPTRRRFPTSGGTRWNDAGSIRSSIRSRTSPTSTSSTRMSAGPDPAAWSDLVLAETSHGGRFASAVSSGSLVGVQFHPERSGRDGLRLLANFVAFARERIEAPVAARSVSGGR